MIETTFGGRYHIAHISAQKKALAAQQTVVFIDEVGFYLLPALVRTYAPRGQTPILNHTLTRDHVSGIGALTSAGRFLLHVQQRALHSGDVVRFLKHLQRHIGTRLQVVWDGAPIHYTEVRTFLAGGAARDIHSERLPAYAPDLNPVEGVWRSLKYVELKNIACHTLQELRAELRLAVARFRHRAPVIAECLAQPGCY